MRRFFIPSQALQENPPSVTGSEAVHIAAVLRMKPGDPVILIDGTGRLYEASITTADKKRVTFRVHKIQTEPETTRKPVVLAQALLKDRKMELLIRQSAELGISEMIPYNSERSVPSPDDDRMKTRRKRWEKIVYEAMKQSGRNTPMRIGSFIPFPEIIALGCRFDIKILFWEKAAKPLSGTSIKPGTNVTRSLLAVLGPEGGFSESEAVLAAESGFILVSLGPRILKAETAAITAAALLQYFSGNLQPADPYPFRPSR